MVSPYAIGLFYFFHLGVVGVLLPYLPPYLNRALGLQPSQLGLILAVSPAMAIVVPPLWGYLADCKGNPTWALWRASGFSLVGLGLLLVLAGPWQVAAGLMLYSAGFAGVVPLADSVALGARQVPYARLRVMGSIGFATVALSFGEVLRRWPALGTTRLTLWVAIGLCATAASVAFFAVRTDGPVSRETALRVRPSWRDALRLGQAADFRRFTLAALLHWIAQGPYNGFLGLIMRERGFGEGAAGNAFAVAVASEIVAMAIYTRLAHRFRVPWLLGLAYLASALRWTISAEVTSYPALVSAQALHGLTFGIFYVGAVAQLRELVPESLRATGQAAFVAVTFGVGGVVGYLVAGAAFNRGGASHALYYATGFELAATVALIWAELKRSDAPTETI